MTMTDYVPGDEFDWDQSDESQYCKHGTFIGSWWGPDVLCGYCEDGTTDAEYREIMESRRHAALVTMANALVFVDVGRIASERRDSIRANRERFSVWIAGFLAEVKATDTASLAAYVKAVNG